MTKRHKDQLEAKPKDVKKEEEAKTKEKDEDSEEILIGKTYDEGEPKLNW